MGFLLISLYHGSSFLMKESTSFQCSCSFNHNNVIMQRGFPVEKNNDLITWTKSLSVGIKVIDDQHKVLVNLLNEMFNHVTGNYVQECDYFNRVIEEVGRYVKYHFATEEKIMLATNYQGYREHKREHDNFIITVKKNILDYKAGKRFTLSTFTRFLKDWVLSHIALVDKQYIEHLKKNLPV